MIHDDPIDGIRDIVILDIDTALESLDDPVGQPRIAKAKRK